eukprot:scaffold139198_cov28-Tisochrysis_lutea.AAC.1
MRVVREAVGVILERTKRPKLRRTKHESARSPCFSGESAAPTCRCARVAPSALHEGVCQVAAREGCGAHGTRRAAQSPARCLPPQNHPWAVGPRLSREGARGVGGPPPPPPGPGTPSRGARRQ